MRKIEVMGSGYARPQHRIDNQDLETILDTSDEWIVQRTGIHSRYVSTEETTSMLAARAAQAALDNAGVDKEAITLLIVATLSGDQPMPSTACLVQEQLGMMDQDLAAFDLNAACGEFCAAVCQRHAGDGRCALIIGAENNRVIIWTDRGTSILFGDGASAMIIRGLKAGSWHFARSDLTVLTSGQDAGDRLPQCGRALPLSEHGWPRYSAGRRHETIEEVLKRAGKTIDEADLIIPHQANIRILAAVARHMGLPMERFFVNLDEFGNTSAASVPIAFAQAMEQGRLSKGMNVILVGFGGGLTYGASWLEL
ncbi:MAG: beta-ketoacyl-ACP synthase 3 [Merdibacter sp.]